MAFLAINLGLVLLFRLWFLFPSWRTIRAFANSAFNTDRRVPLRSVSVLIPARNEQANIGPCLQAVLQQDYPILEIIVVDDGSTDQTSFIVQQMQREHDHLHLIRSNGPPPGWLGKNYALYQGAQLVRGEFLLCLDADVRLAPQCLRYAMQHALEYDSDLLTMLPVVQCVGFWEKVILPICAELFLWSLVPLRQPLRRLIKHQPTKPVAFGGFLLFKKKAYDQIGGHKRIKGSIIEDVDLARAIKQAGHRLHLLLGCPAFLTTRMYVNFAHIWEGLSKSIRGLTTGQLLLGIYLCFSIFVLPWLAIPVALGVGWLSGWNALSVGVLTLGVSTSGVALLSRWYLARTTRLEGRGSYWQPLGGLMLVAMLVNALLRAALGLGAHWKGRHVPLSAKKKRVDNVEGCC